MWCALATQFQDVLINIIDYLEYKMDKSYFIIFYVNNYLCGIVFHFKTTNHMVYIILVIILII